MNWDSSPPCSVPWQHHPESRSIRQQHSAMSTVLYDASIRQDWPIKKVEVGGVLGTISQGKAKTLTEATSEIGVDARKQQEAGNTSECTGLAPQWQLSSLSLRISQVESHALSYLSLLMACSQPSNSDAMILNRTRHFSSTGLRVVLLPCP